MPDPGNSEGDNQNGMSTSLDPRTFHLYARRWWILFILGLLQFSNAMIWLSYAPIADYTATFYHSTTDMVNYLSLVYMVASALFGVMSAFVLDYMGLRAGIIVGAWLNVVGAGIKLLSAFPDVVPSNTQLTVAFIGQSVSALAQPYIMFATTKLAALWFPEEHRALANTIGSMANPLGIMVGSLLAPAIVNPSPGAKLDGYFQTLLGVHCGPALLAAILSVFVITSSKPPTPPSASAETESMPFKDGIVAMFKTKSYWLLMICCGAGVALFTVLTTILQQILCPHGYSDTYAGTCGAVMIAAGIVGAAITGVLADKTKKFEEIAKTFYAFAIVSSVLFAIVARYPNQHALVMVTVGAFGFFGFGLYPICLELGVEVTYPVAEATSTAFIIMSGQVQGIAYLVIMQALAVDFSTPNSACSPSVQVQDFTNALLFFNCMAFVICVSLIIFFNANYKRMRAEQASEAQRILGFQPTPVSSS